MRKIKVKNSQKANEKQLQFFDDDDSFDLENNREPEWKEKFADDKIELNDTIKSLEKKIINIEADSPGERFLWQRGLGPAMNRLSGSFYSGENLWILMDKCKKLSYTTNHWATYRQWKKLGASRKSENENYTFIKLFTPKYDSSQQELQLLDQNGRAKDYSSKNFRVRHFKLYNADQVSWKIDPGQGPLFPDQTNSYEKIELFLRTTGVKIFHSDESESFCKDLDYIKMPFKARFMDSKCRSELAPYYSLIFQELILWVLKKDQTQSLASINHPFEKLVTELGGSMLSGIFQVQFAPNKENYVYYDAWIKMFSFDMKFLFYAQNQALNALNWLLYKTDILDLKVKERSLYPLPTKVIEELNAMN